MNDRIIQNINGKATVRTMFRGRQVELKPKHSIKLDHNNEEERALYEHLLGTFGFVVDRTAIYGGEELPLVEKSKDTYARLVSWVEENIGNEVSSVEYHDDCIKLNLRKESK